jgi:hypothetical protein
MGSVASGAGTQPFRARYDGSATWAAWDSHTSYMFYVELEEDVESPGFRPVMKILEENTDYLKVLGSY